MPSSTSMTSPSGMVLDEVTSVIDDAHLKVLPASGSPLYTYTRP